MAFGMSPFPLQFGSRGGGGASVFTPHFWVDSENGDDGNDGATLATALQTLGAGETLAESIGGDLRVALVGGSEWRGKFIPAGLSSLDLRGVLSSLTDPFPHISALQVLANASFTKTDGLTNVYQIDVTHDMEGSQYLIGYEGGRGLTATASTAACDALPGSYYTTNTTATGQTLYVHPNDSTNPISDGKVYEATAHAVIVGTVGYPTHIENISLTGAGDKNGPVGWMAGGKRIIFRKHNIHDMICIGTLDKLVTYDPQDLTPRGLSGCNPVVGFDPATSGDVRGPQINTWYCHSDFAVIGYYKHTASAYAIINDSLNGFFFRNAGIGAAAKITSNGYIEFTDQDIASHQISGYDEGTVYDNIVLIGGRGYINQASGYAVANDLRLHHGNALGASLGGFLVGTIDISQSTLSVTTEIYDNIFASPSTGLRMTDSVIEGGRNVVTEATAISLADADSNVYYAGGSNQWWTYDGTLYTNLAAWQGAPPGLDANSVQADPLLGDPSNNDWSIGEGSPANTGGRSAGSRKHIEPPDWDEMVTAWNQHYLGFDGHVPPP